MKLIHNLGGTDKINKRMYIGKPGQGLHLAHKPGILQGFLSILSISPLRLKFFFVFTLAIAPSSSH